MDLRDSILRYGFILGKRYHWKQKQKFTGFIGEEFQKMGYEVFGQLSDRKKDYAMNLIVGDLAKAKKIVIAHYDTPYRLLLPVKYYPMNEKKSFKASIISANIPNVAIFVLGVLILAFGRNYFGFNGLNLQTFLSVLTVLAIGVLSFIFSVGLANKINLQRNSAAVVAVLALAERLKNKKDIAYVLTDRECSSHEGDRMILKSLPNTLKDREVIHLKGLAKGPVVGIGYQSDNEKAAQRFEKIVKEKQETVMKLFDEEQVKSHSLIFYPQGITISSGEMEDNEIVQSHTSTAKDSEVDLEFLESLILCIEYYLN